MTIAMLFLIEATAACGPAAPARLGGGAEVMPAILEVEDQAPDAPVLTPAGLLRSTGVAPRDARLETDEPESDPAPARCKPALVPIV